jgi:maltose O-acetyltransferase
VGEMKAKLLRGEPYNLHNDDPELRADLYRCSALVHEFNQIPATERDRRHAVLTDLLGAIGPDSMLLPPIHVNFGFQTTIGARTFVNAGVTILDAGRVDIGDDVRVGPGVQLLTPVHPLDPDERRSGVQWSEPITIGDNAWLGGGVIVCPGVTIGADAVVGAGSVVTADIPPRVVAAGNPCRVIREI